MAAPARGLGIRCPKQVAERLRAAGWVGATGYWTLPGTAVGLVRWWDAVSIAMRPAQAGDAMPVMARCQRTSDLFGQEAA